MHNNTAQKKDVMKITLPWSKVAIGHQSRTGHHVHDPRPRRQRTRKAALKAAMGE